MSLAHTTSEAISEEAWQALWNDSPQRSAFSSVQYAQCAAKAHGLRTRAHWVSDAGTPVAGAIMYGRARLGRVQAVVPPFTQYSALVLNHAPSETAIHRKEDALAALLESLEGSYSRVQLLAKLADPRPAQWRGWQVSPLFTYELTSEQGVESWSASARAAHKKHQGEYYVVEGPDMARDIVKLCAKSYQRHQRKLPANQDAMVSLIGSLGSAVRCFIAQSRKTYERLAGLAVLHDGQTAHYWLAGSVPGPSMTVLLGEVLPELYAAGIKTFDLVGANTPSIAEFKRRFGPRLTQYYALSWRS